MLSAKDYPERRIRRRGLLETDMTLPALKQAVLMLRPDIQWKNPVMFVVETGAFLILLYILHSLSGHPESQVPSGYFIALDSWLFLTVLFSNFATALAEMRGRAQADSLRRTRKDTLALRLLADGGTEEVSSAILKTGDRVVILPGQTIPGDGEIVEGIASIDESAITGESAPVVRAADSDRSGVTGGTTVLSDRIVVRISGGQGESFLDRMIALVEGSIRQKSANEVALTLLLSAFTLIFMVVVIPLWPLARATEAYMSQYAHLPLTSLGTDVPVLVALLSCLVPTTIGALLSAIGIAGMDRALQANVIAGSGKAVEMAGDVDVILLDKTGTITLGNRSAAQFIPVEGYTETRLATLAGMASLSDTTPEGKSIVKLCEKLEIGILSLPEGTTFSPFSAHTRTSSVQLPDGRQIYKGAPDAIMRLVKEQQGSYPASLDSLIDNVASRGATPLVVAEDNRIAGVIALEDILKPHMRERFAKLRAMGLKTIMITGDNPKTAAAIAAEAGIDDYLAEATPAAKLEYIRSEQAKGKRVAMTGDGTNDAPALAQADVAMAMNAGTDSAREAANMVDLDSDPTKLIQIIEIGKQLLITRGALTTFSIATDVAKYFVIIPALFAGTLPWLERMDILHLHSPASAILSAVIFNALVIPVLIPIALKGVRYRALHAEALLRRNLLCWGLSGLLLPFPLIKLIDLVMTTGTGWVN